MRTVREDFSLAVFLCMTACRTSEVKDLKVHLLPVNLLVTPKPDYREVAGRRRISKSWLYEQKRDSEECIVDEKVHDSKVRSGAKGRQLTEVILLRLCL